MAIRLNRLRPIDRVKNAYDKAHDFFSHNVLLLLTLLSVFFGLLFGFFLRPLNLSQDTLNLINFPGEIFMQVLKMMILPLIFSSLISALAQMDAREAGQMGLATVLYYLTTTILATMLGIALVITIHPGDPSVKEGILAMESSDTDVSPLDTFLDLVRNMFPENIIQATFERVQTEYVTKKPPSMAKNGTNNFKKRISPAKGTNILGIIVFCTAFGIVISHLGEKARIVVDFFVILDAVIMRWVEALMWFAPLGIFCLISGNLLELDDLGDTAQMLFLYVVTITLGFLIHAIIVTPLLYFLCTRKNPLVIVKGMLQALVTAFGTASGGAALPTSMQCLEENCGIDRRIARFVLPLGSTINMDGNALYEAVAVIFIAQLNNVELSFVEVITVSVTATVASIGLGSVPAGLVSILLILSTVGLPAKDVSLIITVDWLLDRIRTSVNVLGDGFAAGVVAHILKSRLEESDQKHDYRHEIKEEIEQLKSGAPSRKPSNFSGWSFNSRDFLGPLSQSRPISRRNSGILSWRYPFSAAPSDPSYTPLPKVDHV
ncbi:glt-6 [Pristionchus pacificus]|nr:glt-6 [Pristionchus pacificus]